MAIKGSLKEASLADVCQLLAMGQKNGCLSITDGSRFGQIYFERGRIIYARLVNRRDRLGDVLVRGGRVSEEQLRAALDRQRAAPDRRLGELLVEGGAITRAELERALRVQVEEAIYFLFTWSRGSFFFEVDEAPDSAELLVSINPEGLLLEAARRVDEWGLIEKKIPSLDLIFEVETDRLREAGVELTAEQERILPLLDGRRTVQELVEPSGLTEFDVGKALFGLIQAGFAHGVGRRSAEEADKLRPGEIEERLNLGVAFYRTGMFEDATREFQRVLHLSPGDAGARHHLALIALREGRYREGLRAIRQLVEERGPNFGAFLNMAYALRRLGRAGDALLVLDEAEALRPGTPRVALARGTALLDRGDAAAARDAFAEYRRRLGDAASPSPVYFYFASLAAGVAGTLDEAHALAAEGVALHPGVPLLFLAAGAVEERRGNLEAAERYYRTVVEESPTLPQAHKSLGDVAYRRGQHDEALDRYRRAVELAPALGDDVFAKLGNLHYKRREREEALACWRRALELNPENRVVRNNLEIVAHAG